MLVLMKSASGLCQNGLGLDKLEWLEVGLEANAVMVPYITTGNEFWIFYLFIF